MDVDCYKLLEIPPDADEKTIRRAWKLKTKESHPDVSDSIDAAMQFMKYTEAMELLLDSTRRLQHDRRFGYYNKPKNQDTNAKNTFSEFQQKKAENLVKSWSGDYEKAMQMREEQRLRVIARNKRQMKVVILIFVMIILAVLGAVLALKTGK